MKIFNNSCVYKIKCKNPDIMDEYIGSTINFGKRRTQHKKYSKDCRKETKVYKFIRENGGWDNWEMIELIKCPDVKSKRELHEIEYKYYIDLNPSLNSNAPISLTEKAKKARQYTQQQNKLKNSAYEQYRIQQTALAYNQLMDKIMDKPYSLSKGITVQQFINIK